MVYSDTIVAMATAPGKGAIAVIRISGTDAIDIAHKCFQPKRARILESKKAIPFIGAYHFRG